MQELIHKIAGFYIVVGLLVAYGGYFLFPSRNAGVRMVGGGICGFIGFQVSVAAWANDDRFAFALATILFVLWALACGRYWLPHLTPHPAQAGVKQAILTGEPLDQATAAALSATPSGDARRDEIVAEQARSLAAQLNAHAAHLAAQEKSLMSAELARLEKQNELVKAQRDLAEAVVEHEAQAARVATLQRELAQRV